VRTFEIARDPREHRADEIADRDIDAEHGAERYADHDPDRGDRGVLPVEVGARAFLDGRGNLLHARVSGGRGQDRAARQHAIDQCHPAARDDKEKQHSHGTLFPR
jgi:hypothetical protein